MSGRAGRRRAGACAAREPETSVVSTPAGDDGFDAESLLRSLMEKRAGRDATAPCTTATGRSSA